MLLLNSVAADLGHRSELQNCQVELISVLGQRILKVHSELILGHIAITTAAQYENMTNAATNAATNAESVCIEM